MSAGSGTDKSIGMARSSSTSEGMRTSTNDETAIRALIETLAKATRLKDPGAVVDCFTPDRVQFLLAPPLQYTPAQPWDAKALKAWFATFSTPLGYDVTDLHVTAGSDVAFSRGLRHLTGTKTDGSKSDLWFRETLCFCKLGGAWKITHQHQSVPFLMDGSYKAAIDLKP